MSELEGVLLGMAVGPLISAIIFGVWLWIETRNDCGGPL